MKFEKVQSLCAECGRPVPAAYVRRGEAVYLEKECPEHGVSYVLASENAETFERWLAFPSVTVPPRVSVTEGRRGLFTAGDILNTECPLHCGVCENHLMTACCVLLNITDRCNQCCPYCFANARADEKPGGEKLPGAGKTLDIDNPDPPLAEIDHWLDRLIWLGEERKFNIQLSGGEPTVRDDLPEIIRTCRTKGFEYVQLNTNGRRLAEDGPAYAKTLKAAGLSTVFLQFDGIDDDVYLALRGEPLLEVKKTAIRNCGIAGLPVTLVPTILKNVNLGQTGAIIDFLLENVSVVKGVHFQPASFFGRRPDERNADGDFDERVTMFAVMDEIERQTGGLVRKTDLAPISTGHPLCCFCAAFMKERGGELRPLSSGGSCCESGSGSQGDDSVDSLEIIRRDRDFVLNKWDISVPDEKADNAAENNVASGRRSDAIVRQLDAGALQKDTSGDAVAMSFDEAIAMFRNNMFTISGMAFMDETNLDAERLRRCRVQVFTPDERLAPFCGYYSSGSEGRRKR